MRQSSGRRSYGCKSEACTARVSINLDGLDEYVTTEALARFGDEPVYRTVRRGGVDVEALAAIEAEVAEVAAAMTEDEADMGALGPRLASLKARRCSSCALIWRPASPMPEMRDFMPGKYVATSQVAIPAASAEAQPA